MDVSVFPLIDKEIIMPDGHPAGRSRLLFWVTLPSALGTGGPFVQLRAARPNLVPGTPTLPLVF